MSTPATITISNQVYSYTPNVSYQASFSTTPANLSTSVTYTDAGGNVSSTAPSTIGNYTVNVTITDPNYTGSGTAILTISNVTILAKKRPIAHVNDSEAMILRHYQAILETVKYLLTDGKGGNLETAKQLLAAQVNQNFFKQNMGSVHNKRVVNFR